MPKKFIRRILPDHTKVRNMKVIKLFGRLLHNPNLWCLNRRSASGAFAVGLFTCFIPLPSQMFIAALGAIAFRVNIPIAISLVWISNPITIPIMFYFAYLVGKMALDTPPYPFHFELDLTSLIELMNHVGPTFLAGCFICASVFAFIGYFSIQWIWRYSVARAWEKRNKKS